MVTKGSVLVVDDEVNLCRIIGAKLARSGYSVVTVHDGLQAVEKVRDSDFDVVLLDLILPKMDGLSALAAIRGIHDALPVIVMTACENAEILEQAKHYGVSAYVSKPFDLDTLVSLVSNTFCSAKVGGARKLPESTVLFGAGQPITLEIQNGCGAKLYLSRISGKDNNTLSVATPSSTEGFIEAPPRASVKVGLATHDAFYSFTTYVLRTATEPENMIVLEKPSVIYRVQRREHARSDVRVRVAYTASESDGDKPEYASGETRDVSLGGTCIVVPEEVLPGEMIRLVLQPESVKDKVVTTACVVRSRPSAQPDCGYTLGCRFISSEGPLQKLLAE